MGKAKIGKPSYKRTEEHKLKMSVALNTSGIDFSNRPQTKALAKMASGRKGKTLEQIWGSRAADIRRNRPSLHGENNPNWKGGKARNKYPYIFFRLRATILERDGLICMNCGMNDMEHRDKYTGRGLTIHHIDYNKLNNSLDNLITLCIWCNSKANSKREIWQAKYRALLGA